MSLPSRTSGQVYSQRLRVCASAPWLTFIWEHTVGGAAPQAAGAGLTLPDDALTRDTGRPPSSCHAHIQHPPRTHHIIISEGAVPNSAQVQHDGRGYV